ncbi:hypothetical protein AB0K60_14125 [Thermopolyspora sp. NPDC052614]|uniref:hypothetical protein n=1 Tax=Thermopolyspora sp. NPDC052614 TaxID=3155682 RepID=UPI003421C911
MPPIDQITSFAANNPVGTAIVCASALIVLVLAFLVLRNLIRTIADILRKWAENRPAEDILTIVAASIATGVSAQGMWRFSGDVLGFDGPLRLLLFAFIEVAVITSAVRARRNMRENFSAGIDGIAVWALTSLSAVLSAMDARSLAEAVFRLAAPLVAAWLWERGMAIERHRITGRSRINWRLTPERVMVRLGLAEASDRTASEVDAHRRLTRVALAAKRARALRAAGASERRMRRALSKLDRAMDQAVEYTGLAVDPTRQEALLSQIGALYNSAALMDLKPPVPWEPEQEEQAPPALVGQTAISASTLDPAASSASGTKTRHQMPAPRPSAIDDDEDEDEVEVLEPPAQTADPAQRAVLYRAARAYWDRQIERKFVPRAADIAKETGLPLATAREYRALWKLEPRAHALLEAAYNEHGERDTGTFPAIEVEARVLTANGASSS